MGEIIEKNVTKVVPFGKYRGQPIEVLAQDPDYKDWVLAQPWVRERFQSFYTIIVNNFTEASETPEHNALQARFLDVDFCQKLVTLLMPTTIHDLETSLKLAGIRVIRPQFEVAGWDIVLEVVWDHPWVSGREFRVDIFLELKPSLGDNYPAVLRQIKVLKSVRSNCLRFCHLLIVGVFNARGASLDQVRKIFELSNIRLILLDEILS